MTDVLFFSSPIGLGHATRDAAIAKQFQTSAKFVTGGEAARFFAENGFEVENAYNPPNFNIQKGTLQNPLKWLWKYYRYYMDCKAISSDIIKKHNPKLVVSDEDFASLAIAQENNIPSILITDVLETRFTKGLGRLIEKKMNRSMCDIIKKCNTVILPEKGKNQDNIKRVGPIVRETQSSRQQLRERFGFSKQTVLVAIGGTDAGKFLIDEILKIIPRLEYDFVIVSGPSLKIKLDGVKNLGFVGNLHELIFASDVLVSLAGKSTIDEANAYGTPGIFIPIKGHFEQEDNAKDEGFSYKDLEKLENLIIEKLNQKREPAMTDGAKKACKIIEEFLN